MHIEPGILSGSKILLANVTAAATLSTRTPALFQKRSNLLKAVLAAIFFSLFMQAFHLKVGPSELHFIGASAVYFTFGFLPTMFGFGLGLLLQGLFFEPRDLVHLGVNSLSLIVPLVAAHHAAGKSLFVDTEVKQTASWSNIVRFDAVYYSGVVGMVGFWLLMGDEPTPLTSWAVFSLSYLPLVICEPIFTRVVLKSLSRLSRTVPVVPLLTSIQQLSL